MRSGIFGGTFDPPHNGHLILAEKAVDALQLDRLLWVLTPNPPHKPDQQVTVLRHRIDMLNAAIADHPCFRLSHIDINRPPPHYAVGTLRLLRERFTDDELIYLMGADSLRDLPTWHAPQAFVQACDLIAVARRPGVEIDMGKVESHIPGITPKVCFVDAPLLDISASEIRSRVRAGDAFRHFLPPLVYQIIKERGLYGSLG